ncbi:hypothetical protein Clacol_003905 [Clathrus columnatus]|uniref:BZIP domain-containing protein n=1 Tax=Clathrus columnatus TaxID=1419009 RepID=A0AAV5AB04_9AGAM|nr:hypothetical protein Clacol_003905 [Clathrus columnatus]
MSPVIPLQQLPNLQAPHPISSNEPQLSQAQVASMRRKKNADAQAAFRARRANYISSLEETVISLEAVVLSLQDSCRESRNDADELRQESNHLRSIIEVLQKDSKDREKQWREFWIAKLHALGLDDPHHLNDFPPHPPSSQNLNSIQSATYNSRPPSFVGSDALRFSAGQRFQSSSTGITTYSANSDPNWVPASSFSNTRTTCIGDSHPSHPSSASDSPSSISPSIPYGSRFSLVGEDGRNNVNLVGVNMSNASYETSSLITEYGSENYSTSVTRHSFSESERCVRPRRSYSGPHPRAGGDFYGAADISPTESDHLNSEDHSSVNGSDLTHTRPRRHTSASIIPHSPSLSPPPTRDRDFRERDAAISNTLAVIKAQAFGSLRRTRTRVKKPSDSASKVAIDLLSARGIGLGLQSPVAGGTTTPRLHIKRKSECLDDVEI